MGMIIPEGSKPLEKGKIGAGQYQRVISPKRKAEEEQGNTKG